MPDSAALADDLEARRRRARYRAWHRGMREVDLLLGPFADRRVDAMSASALADFEALLAEADQTLLAWIVSKEPAPDAGDVPFIAELRRFHAKGPSR